MSYRQRRDSPRNSSSGNYGGGSRRQSYGGSGGGGGGGGGSQVNPWQGGIVPGGNQMLSLLPTPSQSGLLSQLTTPEAQLAMATNLLNKILSPQQNQQTSNVPSLLSLPGPMNRNMSYNDYRSRSSFPDRRRERLGDRRMQPYNKSGLNRRGDGKSRLGNSRTSDKSSGSPKLRKKESDDKDKKNKDGEKANGEVSVEDDKSKRDNDGDKKAKDSDKESDKALGAAYTGVPNSLLSCHVCHKNMWDATSFEKHVTGRRHQMMMEQLDETYKIKVELLRHEQRAAESQRELEIERLERQGKKVFNNKREYCTMCDLHFYGNLISHRKKDRHQKLKSFLHPKCHLCHKEFPNRLEWDDHKLSAPHLLKLADYHRTTKPGVKDEDMAGNDIESVDGGDASVFAELVDDLDLSKEGKKMDIDFNDIPTSVEEYNAEAPVGSNFVVEVSGHLCKLCSKFLNTCEEAAVHAKTLSHYKNFAAVVKMKAKAEKNKEAAEAKARKDDKRKERDDKDDEGNWKRQKVTDKNNESKDDDAKVEGNVDNVVVKLEPTSVDESVTSEKESEAKEKYDPENAEEEENEEKEPDEKGSEVELEEEQQVRKVEEGGPPTRGRGKGGRGGGFRGKARRGK